jgi:hypothetical protein
MYFDGRGHTYILLLHHVCKPDIHNDVATRNDELTRNTQSEQSKVKYLRIICEEIKSYVLYNLGLVIIIGVYTNHIY